MAAISNVVGKKELRKIQGWTLDFLKSVVLSTFGPNNSNTVLISEKTYNEYSKDGHTVLNDIQFGSIIEQSIKTDIALLTNEIALTVGDGTTTGVYLASVIFNAFAEKEDSIDIKPFELMERLKSHVELIKEDILTRKKEFNADMAYKIAYIATNGNAWVAEQIKSVYEKYGNDVCIEVKVSPNEDTYLREYEGLNLETGYADHCYQNVPGAAVCEINNANIYAFEDPIDTPDMGNVFKAIIEQNIVKPSTTDGKFIPTVILCPKIGHDYDSFMSIIAETLIRYENVATKPPILVVTNIRRNELFSTIVNLCGAKWIKKFINPEVKKEEIEKAKKTGEATVATPTNFQAFAGQAGIVRADSMKTTFVAPKDMYEETGKDATDENGNTTGGKEVVLSAKYKQYIANLQNALEEAERETKDLNIIGGIRRTIHCLQSTMVDFSIGGITVGDRDSLRHLVEDAVKSCASAAKYGVGYAANFEGLTSAMKLVDKDDLVGPIIANAYEGIIKELYGTCLPKDVVDKVFEESIEKGMPIDLRAREFNGNVLGSIMADPVILETIAKIVGLIITSNQAILPTVAHMVNYTPKEYE